MKVDQREDANKSAEFWKKDYEVRFEKTDASEDGNM